LKYVYFYRRETVTLQKIAPPIYSMDAA
jgi:hypothetical protein